MVFLRRKFSSNLSTYAQEVNYINSLVIGSITCSLRRLIITRDHMRLTQDSWHIDREVNDIPGIFQHS